MTVPGPTYSLTLTGDDTALILATAHQEYHDNLKMCAVFTKAAKDEHAPELANLGKSYMEATVRWERIGRQCEAINPNLEPENWRPTDDNLEAFLDALHAIGFRLTKDE